MKAYFRLVMLLALTSRATWGASAQGVDERTIDLVIASKNCPSAPLPRASICQEIRDSCAANVSWECDAKARACGTRERELNAKINVYNSIYYTCEKARADRKEAETKTKPSSGSESPLSRALRQQKEKEKSQNTDEINRNERQTLERQSETRRAEEAARQERGEQERKDREAQRAIDEERERRRQLDEEKYRRDMAEAAKWHCFTPSDTEMYGAKCQRECTRAWGYWHQNECYDQCNLRRTERYRGCYRDR